MAPSPGSAKVDNSKRERKTEESVDMSDVWVEDTPKRDPCLPVCEDGSDDQPQQSGQTTFYLDAFSILADIGQRSSGASSSGAHAAPVLEVQSSQEEQTAKLHIKSQWVDPVCFKMVFVLTDSSLHTVDLREGSSGFAECTFGGQ
eukprot:7675799-Lingulodinium_polyedra.AAC.1